MSTGLALVPEGVVLLTSVGLWAAARLLPRGRWVPAVALGAAVLAFALELWLGAAVGAVFGGAWSQDRFGLFAKAALLLGLAVLVAAADWDSDEVGTDLALAFLAVLGGMVVASTSSLPGLWVGLELATLVGVAAIGLARRPPSPMAVRLLPVAVGAAVLLAVGYAVLGASAASLGLAGLRRAFLSEPDSPALAFAVLLTLAGFSVRLLLTRSRWTTLEGGLAVGATAVGVLGGLVVGVAALAAMKLEAGLVGVSPAWTLGLAALATCAVVVGGMRAVTVVEPRPLAAWLVVAQAGWVAAGLATHDRRGTAAALLLTGALLLSATAAPALAAGRGSRAGGVTGLARREPGRAAGLTLVLLSLAGAPPLAGFFGEFAVAAELVRSNLAWVLAAGLLGWVLSLAGAVRLLRAVYLEGPAPEARRGGRAPAPVWAVGPLVPAALVLAYGVFANPIHGLAVQGATALGLH
jgi:NADH-quinone oxidoreductase subunit N